MCSSRGFISDQKMKIPDIKQVCTNLNLSMHLMLRNNRV